MISKMIFVVKALRFRPDFSYLIEQSYYVSNLCQYVFSRERELANRETGEAIDCSIGSKVGRCYIYS